MSTVTFLRHLRPDDRDDRRKYLCNMSRCQVPGLVTATTKMFLHQSGFTSDKHFSTTLVMTDLKSFVKRRSFRST